MCRKQPDGSWRYCPSRRPSPASDSTPPAAVKVARPGLDAEQAGAVYVKAWNRTGENFTPVTDQQWQEWCSGRAQEASTEQERAAFQSLAQSPPADPRQARACVDLADSEQRARRAVQRQTHAVAGLHGVSEDAARERIAAYRAQYAEQYADLDPQARPDPPAEWVEGFTRKDRMAVSVPNDPATLYAFYRAQADPEAFPGRARRWASVDLETAGPVGKAAFDPTQGSIIEVGVVTYDDDGVERERLSCLVHPAPEAESTYRTGAVNIHGIGWEDVQDAPEWAEVAPQTEHHLRGATLLAQNDRFEREWLGEHMHRADADFDPDMPGVDTMRIAQQHFSRLPSHRLSSICEHLGVDYTDGHRATHDAVVAAQAFFAMRERIHTTWRSSPLHASLPQPETAPVREREMAS